MKVKHIETVEELQEIIQSNWAVIDFYKDNCTYCKLLDRKVKALDWVIKDESAVLYKAHLETLGLPAFKDLNIMSTPTVIVFKEGVEWSRKSGDINPKFMQKMIEGDQNYEV